ncbi:MAG: ATP-binding protein [Planctomycetota bacterium]
MLRDRLKWFLFYRLIIAILGLVAILIYHLGQQASSQSLLPPKFPPHVLGAYLTLIFTCLINVIYILLIKYLSPVSAIQEGQKISEQENASLRKLALLQIGIDIIIETLLAYFTGGSGSIFVSLYFASILAANILVTPRMGLFFASVSSTLLAIVTILYSLSAAGRFTLPLLPPEFVKTSAQGFRFLLPYLFFFVLILHFVAFAAGRLVNELTMERQLRSELKRRTEMLEVLKEMSIGIAHELRNPLTAIRGAVQSLSQKKTLPISDQIAQQNSQNIPKRSATWIDEQKLINTILKETDRLNRIISDFLDFTRERPVLTQNVNLTEIIQDVVMLINQDPKSQGNKTGDLFNIGVDAEANIYCKVDPEQIKQVLYNLIYNAVEASSPGSKITVKVYSMNTGVRTIRSNQNRIAIEVIDYGRGIPTENIKKIFEPFFTTKPQGVGLGLAIAHRIVKAHNGEITVESGVSKGSKFTVLLPMN